MFFSTRTGTQPRAKLTSHMSLAGKDSSAVAMEKRMQYKQNKNVFPNVSMQRRRGHDKLQQSLSAEGYLEPTISGVCEPSSRLSVSGNASAWHKTPAANTATGENNLRSPNLAVRSVSAEHDDGEYNASDVLTERHSYHGSSRALVREASPDPPRYRSPSPYSSANPPPPPVRTTPSQPAAGSARASPLPPETHGSSEKLDIHGMFYKPPPPQRLSPLTLHADYKEVRENMEKVNSIDAGAATRQRSQSMGSRHDKVGCCDVTLAHNATLHIKSKPARNA